MRESWTSKVGFIWAAIGSAVGLGSIWRFPYLVGQNGGAWFVLLFLVFLFVLSFPTFITETAIGRSAQKSPSLAFARFGTSKGWKSFGFMTVLTGFIVSSFYGVVCSWTLKYVIDSFLGITSHFTKQAPPEAYFIRFLQNPIESLLYLAAFFASATLVLYAGVRKGIESFNQYFMPLLFVILFFLAIKGLTLSGGAHSLRYLFYPEWKSITPSIALEALGQAFFGVSIGQGTLVTYGSYLKRSDKLISTGFVIFFSVVLISLLAGIAIFSFVFAAKLPPASGFALMFNVLPFIFSTSPFGYVLSILFFFLIFVAGFTSQISAMEPMIAYLIDERRLSRHVAATIVGTFSFLLGTFSAISFMGNGWFTFYGTSFFSFISDLSVNFLIPIGGLGALLLAGWKMQRPMQEEMYGDIASNLLRCTFILAVKTIAPVAVVLILLYQALGAI